MHCFLWPSSRVPEIRFAENEFALFFSFIPVGLLTSFD
jgi:hypothetical protein